jgi:hypothetical protein
MLSRVRLARRVQHMLGVLGRAYDGVDLISTRLSLLVHFVDVATVTSTLGRGTFRTSQKVAAAICEPRHFALQLPGEPRRLSSNRCPAVVAPTVVTDARCRTAAEQDGCRKQDAEVPHDTQR